MTIAAVLLVGMLIGAAGMFLSCKRAEMARRSEREASQKRIEKVRSERDAVYSRWRSAEKENTVLRIDQANNAGWHEGYKMAQEEEQAKSAGSDISGMLANGLQDGKNIVFGITK